MPLAKSQLSTMYTSQPDAGLTSVKDLDKLTPSEKNQELSKAIHAHAHGKITDDELDERESHLQADYVEATTDILRNSIIKSIACFVRGLGAFSKSESKA